ncbi:cupin domain-containing protein [Herbiconiux sp. 11R-BC]|uniref:cupin domain-containing protein n=1 Tax=Herbiconiux sp. 11R-BC TaxID=3111637 RepID=UPI003C09E3EB
MTETDRATRAAAYFGKLRDAHVAALWTIPGTLATEPTLDEVPYVWHADEIFPLLFEAVEIADLGEETDRRALNASNPNRVFGTSHNLVAGYQLVLPGETAPAHRHTPSAIRLLLQGSGHTTVDGEPVLMKRGDLVLTPPNTWHDHRHNGDVPMIWLDGLDVPFVRGQHAQFAEEYENGELQKLTKTEDASVHRYFAGLNPVDEAWTAQHSPLNKYPYDVARVALDTFHDAEGAPVTGSTLEYVNPLTGGHVIPTLASYLTLIPEGGRSVRERHTPSKVYCVLEGSGYSLIEGKRYDWAENDFFVVPSWHWYEHVAGSGDAVLFSLSDLPIYEPFGLLRRQIVEPAQDNA